MTRKSLSIINPERGGRGSGDARRFPRNRTFRGPTEVGTRSGPLLPVLSEEGYPKMRTLIQPTESKEQTVNSENVMISVKIEKQCRKCKDKAPSPSKLLDTFLPSDPSPSSTPFLPKRFRGTTSALRRW